MVDMTQKEKMKFWEEIDTMEKDMEAKTKKQDRKMLLFSLITGIFPAGMCVYAYLERQPYWLIFNAVVLLLMWVGSAYFYGKVSGLTLAMRLEFKRVKEEMSKP